MALLPVASLAIDKRGESTFRDNCSECHQLPDPKQLTAKEWERQISEMADMVGLRTGELSDVLFYLQQNSKQETADTTESGSEGKAGNL